MDSDDIERIQNITLTPEEDEIITIRVVQREKTLEEYSLSLIGKFLTTRPINLRVAKTLLRSVWKLGNDLKVVEVGDGLLQFKFSLESQMRWVWDNGPWSFDNNILLLRRWEKGLTVRTASFTHLPMRVQIWGLPFDLINEEAGKDIGRGIGRVVEVDSKALAFEQARFLQVRVEIPLDKPIRRGEQIEGPEGDRVRVAYKYERLMGLWFQCDRLGYEATQCPHPCDSTAASKPYGEWLKVGAKTKREGSQSKADSPPRHYPTSQTPASKRATPIAVTLSKIREDMADNPEFRGTINVDTDKWGKTRNHGADQATSIAQISDKMTTVPEMLKPGPSLNDYAPTQACHSQADLCLQSTRSESLGGIFFTVPISYDSGMHEVKEIQDDHVLAKIEGHVKGVKQHATSCNYAWEVGPNTNKSITPIVAMRKKATRTQSKEKRDTSMDPLIRVGNKRVVRDQLDVPTDDNMAIHKRHKGLASKTNPTCSTTAAASQPHRSP